MPEVKWVSPHSLHATKEGTFNEVPVLTLDDIADDLSKAVEILHMVATNQQPGVFTIKTALRLEIAIDDLLAQVQALKGETA